MSDEGTLQGLREGRYHLLPEVLHTWKVGVQRMLQGKDENKTDKVINFHMAKQKLYEKRYVAKLFRAMIAENEVSLSPQKAFILAYTQMNVCFDDGVRLLEVKLRL